MTTEPICSPLPCTTTVSVVPSPTPTAPSSPDLGPWAVGGFALAVVLIAVGVAGFLFPKKTRR